MTQRSANPGDVRPHSVLILSQHYWPERFPINEITGSLVEAGAAVTVLTGQPNYPEGAVFPGYAATGIGIDRHPEGWEVVRVPLIPRGPGGGMRLIANYLSFLATAIVIGPWLLRGRRIDTIFVYATSPLLQAIAGVWLKWIKRAKLVVWVQDLWPESLSDTGFVRSPAILGVVRSAVRWIYRRSDLVLVQSVGFLDAVRPLAGATPVVVHPNPGPVERPAGADVVASDAPILEPGFNLVFAGNIGTVQAMDTVLDAAASLLDEPDIRFVLVGDGSRVAWAQAEIARRGLANVRLPGSYPRSAMPTLFAQASALLVTLKQSPIMARTVPSKIQAYLAAGRPIIAGLDGVGADLVEQARAGLVAPAEDSNALADAVRRMYRLSAAEREAMGEQGRAYYTDHFDPAVLARQLLAQFDQLKEREESDVAR